MKYHLTYDAKVHPEGLERDEIPEGQGAATAVMMASILRPPDGSLSVAFFSLDGHTGEPLDDHELWKVWMLLSAHLSEKKGELGEKAELCEKVMTAIRQGACFDDD